jgi:signal transduction histidine kinase
MLRLIRQATDHGAALTRRLLAFSRKQAVAPTLTDINRLVFDMSELLQRTLGESITVETVIGGELRPALVDRNQVESALVNLAVNARDAMPAGGILTIETGSAFFDAGSARRHGIAAGEYVFVAVSDNGAGMTEDVQAHAFEPFYTTKEVGRGTGLGLSQVYGFVLQSGGHVELYSEVGRGTTVKMHFPRSVTEHDVAAIEPDAARALHFRTETALVPGNDEDDRSYDRSTARQHDCNVLEAVDGDGGRDPG